MKIQPPASLTLKIATLAVAVVMSTVAIGILAVMTFSSILPRRLADKTTVATAASPGSIISSYTKNGAIAGLSPGAYTLQASDTQTTANISYKAPSHDYTISTPTTNNVLYVATSRAPASDTNVIQSQTTKFMSDLGLAEQPSDQPLSTLTYSTYTSKDNLCQLASVSPQGGLAKYYQLACIKISQVEAEYAKTDQLLALYKAAGSTLTVSASVKTDELDGNKALSIVNIATTNKQWQVLLFAAIDDNWKYLGDLTGDSPATAKSAKYTISPSIKSAINSPEYGDFLTGYIK